MGIKLNLRKWAKGKDCQIRVPGYCNFNPETTVLCHVSVPGISGMGMKPPDECGAVGCSSCHDVIDYRVNTPFSRTEVELMACQAVLRTTALRVKELD